MDWESENRRPLFFTVAYDGKDFSGWQKQKNGIGVCQELENAFQKLFQDRQIRIFGASRTDTGVHALSQAAVAMMGQDLLSSLVANQKPFSPSRILYSLNSLLSPGILIKNLFLVPDSFRVRFDAKGKSYLYFLFLGKKLHPFFQKAWAVGKDFDKNKLKEALATLVGSHDFSSFAKKSSLDNRSAFRTINSIRVVTKGQYLIIIFRGPGFLHHQIRNIMGTAVSLVKNPRLNAKTSRQQMESILSLKDRRQAGRTAPAQGLFLHRVYYEADKLRQFQRLI